MFQRIWAVAFCLLLGAPVALGQPTNDDCLNAIPVTTGVTPYDTTGASTDGGYLPYSVCRMWYNQQVYNDIWFTHVAECDGDLIVSTCGSSYDSKLAVYSSSDCPADSANAVDCNDDASLGSLCQGTYQSEVRVSDVVAGETYLIRVGGFVNSSAGEGALEITCVTPNEDGLEGHWTFDDGEGHFARDASGQSRHGLVRGCPEWTETGQVDGAINFESNGFVRIPRGTFGNVDDEVTIATWVFGGPTQPQAGFLFHGTRSSNPWLLGASVPWSDEQVYFDAGSGAGDHIAQAAFENEYMGQWNHWAFTKNTTTGEMKIYLNGVLWLSGSDNTRSMAGITRFTIGAKTFGWCRMDAVLDDFRVYSRELSAEEVLAIVDGDVPDPPDPPQSSPQSDDFNTAGGLSPIWTVVDPLGDATVDVAGVGTSEARLVVSVPGGVAHDAFNDNEAVRIVQATDNDDFEIEAKFFVEPTQEFQFHGLLVEQDAQNWLRFDLVATDTGLRAFAGVTVDGDTDSEVFSSILSGTPQWVRVSRTGDTWLFTYSFDGVSYATAASFDHALTVNLTGVQVGNQGSPAPAFTAECDYFFNLAAPIDPEDGEVVDPPDPPEPGDTGITSDDFDAATLAPFWTTIDPLGDSTFTVVGAGTGEAVLEIAVPGGVAHDAFNENESPRVMQPTNNTDFELIAKFNTEPMVEFQFQGILVEQDADNWVRFDLVATDSGLRAFAGTTTAGSTSIEYFEDIPSGSPQYVKVNRTGNLWTQSYSFDGVNYTTAATFTYAMIVTSSGVLVGNQGSPTPAFTAEVDFFFDAADPIVAEDGVSP